MIPTIKTYHSNCSTPLQYIDETCNTCGGLGLKDCKECHGYGRVKRAILHGQPSLDLLLEDNIVKKYQHFSERLDYATKLLEEQIKHLEKNKELMK